MSRLYVLFFCFSLLTNIAVCDFELEWSKTIGQVLHKAHGDKNVTTDMILEKTYSSNRKILKQGACTNKDISISQSIYSTIGIPQYAVEIVNTCISGCAPYKVHLHCGWFASARLVNPRTFKRQSYDDCLVNGGMHLKASQMIRFTYSNTFMYPLAFKSARFC